MVRTNKREIISEVHSRRTKDALYERCTSCFHIREVVFKSKCCIEQVV